HAEKDGPAAKIASGLTTDENGIWTSAGNTQQYDSDGDGKADTPFSEGLTSGDYYFVETGATADSVLDSMTHHAFTIEGNETGRVTVQPDTVSLNVVNDAFAAELKLRKYDAEDGTPVDGDVTFVLKRLGNEADGKTYPHGAT
ncbi:hypothetical protein VPJ68_20220, partial [Parabacteroides distasonis]